MKIPIDEFPLTREELPEEVREALSVWDLAEIDLWSGYEILIHAFKEAEESIQHIEIAYESEDIKGFETYILTVLESRRKEAFTVLENAILDFPDSLVLLNSIESTLIEKKISDESRTIKEKYNLEEDFAEDVYDTILHNHMLDKAIRNIDAVEKNKESLLASIASEVALKNELDLRVKNQEMPPIDTSILTREEMIDFVLSSPDKRMKRYI